MKPFIASYLNVRTRRYREGMTEKGEQTYTPRALIFERNENLGSLRPSGYVYVCMYMCHSLVHLRVRGKCTMPNESGPCVNIVGSDGQVSAQVFLSSSHFEHNYPTSQFSRNRHNFNPNRYLYHQHAFKSLDDFKASVPWSGDIDTHKDGSSTKHAFQKVKLMLKIHLT